MPKRLNFNQRRLFLTNSNQQNGLFRAAHVSFLSGERPAGSSRFDVEPFPGTPAQNDPPDEQKAKERNGCSSACFGGSRI